MNNRDLERLISKVSRDIERYSAEEDQDPIVMRTLNRILIMAQDQIENPERYEEEREREFYEMEANSRKWGERKLAGLQRDYAERMNPNSPGAMSRANQAYNQLSKDSQPSKDEKEMLSVVDKRPMFNINETDIMNMVCEVRRKLLEEALGKGDF